MIQRVENKILEARTIFGIKSYPGDFFSYLIDQEDYIEKYNLIVFKEDLDKLSGFISYENQYAYIGINYKRPIGHQNLTLSHELGHYFLHKGLCFSDEKLLINYNIDTEQEAFDFGFEILYPSRYFETDMQYIISHDLLISGQESELGKFVDGLCHKYFLSFDVVLRKLLYYFRQNPNKNLRLYKEKINKSLGKKYTHLDKNFHIANGSTFSCKSLYPYEYLRELIKKSAQAGSISPATGEAILFSHGIEAE